jgi:hypothetical protein
LRDGGTASEKRKTHKHRPKKQEKTVAAALGGRRQPGSGAFDEAKGDVRVERSDRFSFLVECKRTSGKKSLGVKLEWLMKITAEARVNDRYPALAIQFDRRVIDSMPGTAEEDWVAIPLSVMKGMLEDLGEDDIDVG